MANTLNYYNPVFYANEALLALEKSLGMCNRIYRGYDEERRSFGKGDTIKIRKPSTFVVNDAPSTAQELVTGTLDVVLDKWKEVKFAVTDKDLAFGTERLITEHIRPAAYALADYMDQQACALYKDVPWFHDQAGGSMVIADIIDARKIMFDNKVNLNDQDNMSAQISGKAEADLLKLAAFTEYQGAGATGVAAQVQGYIGKKFGFNFYANQNVPSHVKGTCNDTALQIVGTAAKGATTISLDAVDAGVTGTLVAGDVLSITGHTQKYAVTATNTASGNAFTGVTITPGLEAAVTDNTAVTARLDDHVANMLFHRNAFAIAMAPLSEMGKELGAKIATITDPITGLSIRSRLYYVGNSSEVHVALDVLFGFKTIDNNKAIRICS